jgi:hypothetical protein
MTQLPDKPSIDEVMAHSGVMGMHWGIRQPNTKPTIDRLNRVAKGQASKSDKAKTVLGVGRKGLGGVIGVKTSGSHAVKLQTKLDKAKAKGSTTGVSRSSGVLIDRNARTTKIITDARSGEKYRHTAALGKKIFGSETQQKNWANNLSNLDAQDKRLRSGKSSALDVLDKMGTINPFNLVVSRTPKK